jgi:hypothetical protein
VHDATQYVLLAGGEGKLQLGEGRVARPFNARRRTNVFERPRKSALSGRL